MRPLHNRRQTRSSNHVPSSRRSSHYTANRTFDSNGPGCVKIRGNAQHISERYLQLARDAHSARDETLAESYLQHAEHYFRLASASTASRSGQMTEEDEEMNGRLPDRFASPFERHASPSPPPMILDLSGQLSSEFEEKESVSSRLEPAQEYVAPAITPEISENKSFRTQRTRGYKNTQEEKVDLPAFIKGTNPRPSSDYPSEMEEAPEGNDGPGGFHLRNRRRRRTPRSYLGLDRNPQGNNHED